ncbi:MAG: kynureninase [Calditrichaeota bacterium]|nr:kynureninase [Calditrichota bacterium]
MRNFSNDKSYALEQDSQDPLKPYREQFHIPRGKNGEACIYFCGNSLGLQPKAALEYVAQEMVDWARWGVDGHFEGKHPWLPYHEFLTEQTARLVGAQPAEVVVMNTLTVNLHLMMVSFYRPATRRFKVLMEAKAFPSDQYAVQSQVKFHGYDPETAILVVGPRERESYIRTTDIEDVLEEQGESIAMVLLGGVNYYGGQAFEMEKIVQAGHAKGCVVGFDLAHAAGNLLLDLHGWDVDFAVWCSYKYLNGGPGCVAGCFVHERFANRPELPRFSGWWGQNKQTRFRMTQEFGAIPGAEGWQLSNPPILPLASLRAAMDIFDAAGMPALRQKSKRLTGYLALLLQDSCGENVEILTPEDPEQRGCQLSIKVREHGKQLHEILKARSVVCDWREPDVIRVAPVPIYNSFIDVFNFVTIFSEELTQLKTQTV